jgi:hypothetical protein
MYFSIKYLIEKNVHVMSYVVYSMKYLIEKTVHVMSYVVLSIKYLIGKTFNRKTGTCNELCSCFY